MVSASVIVGKSVDDLAIRDTSFGACLDHLLKLGPQGRQAIDAASDSPKVIPRQGIHPGAGALRLSRELDEYGFNLEAELTRMPDEPQPLHSGRVVLPPIASERGGVGKSPMLS
jgi:hypothetical protein